MTSTSVVLLSLPLSLPTLVLNLSLEHLLSLSFYCKLLFDLQTVCKMSIEAGAFDMFFATAAINKTVLALVFVIAEVFVIYTQLF